MADLHPTKVSGKTLHERAATVARSIQNFGWGSPGAYHHGGLSNSDVTLLARAYLELKRRPE
jgi:hypothetical protein